ncbi:transposase [Halobacillus amylolyticus]|uniref:Transposase n=1 Tax=Halobacillus amylolyticus TaxID=2932259 RepID=A0ABY4HA60_9BACI|nr:transposase [Halobacillus amylolyticus]UOR10368.1 transposase [Halobacillus amylolyticus]UOR10906.1 transposase [Halobacillus amylolyticus]UOR11171.1 transposase [Halobacillus amylolyticus]UOR11559.1 transposase [Halobacillus amylolyticus]UOR11567.1 transposase [Halobacillus amylolyticus]
MTQKYRNYDPEFKLYVVKLMELDGHKMTDLSQKLDIPYGNLKRWKTEYRDQKKKEEKEAQNQLLTASEYKEMYEKEKKSNVELQEEVDILKKAMHIFNQEK